MALSKFNHSAGLERPRHWCNSSSEWVGQRTTVSGRLKRSGQLASMVARSKLATLTDDVWDRARLIGLPTQAYYKAEPYFSSSSSTTQCSIILASTGATQRNLSRYASIIGFNSH